MKNCLTNIAAVLFLLGGLAACGGGSSKTTTDAPTPPPPPPGSSVPADTYFSLAVTENSHNHSGAKLLFLDFQGTTPNSSVIQNNVVISPRITNGAITLDGNAADWDAGLLTTVNGLVQNNYPLSEFIDAVPTDITVGSAWDDDYIYFVVQWLDAGYNASAKYKKWIFGGQGSGEAGWNPKVHIGATTGAPNEFVVNAGPGHTLLGKESEDRIFMMFPIADSQNNFSANGLGCAAYCHTNLAQGSPYQNYTGYGLVAMHTNVPGDRADIWHWKSSRTAPSNRADDKHLVYAVGSDDGRTSDSGASAYAGNSLIDGHPQSMHSSGLDYLGDVLASANSVGYMGTPIFGDAIPAVISSIPTNDSRGNVETQSSFNAATSMWTVEFRRLRNTGYSDDRQFNFGSGMNPPVTAAVAAGDATSGAILYNDNCAAPCHQATGSGQASGAGWSFPRIQRASGSLIRKALQTVVLMQSISLNEQQVEDIAAYLQTQDMGNTINNLTVSIVGGVTGNNIISSDPAGIGCPGNCDFDFVDAGVITLTAGSVPGFSFTGWSVAACGGLTCDVTLATDLVVTATYAASTTIYTLDITKTGNGTVSSATAGIDCGADCTEDYLTGNTITLTATPNAGYQFDGWSGGGCSGTGTCETTINADTIVNADFSLITATPTCDNAGVIHDAGASYGLQMMIDEGAVSNPTDIAFIPGSSTAFLVTAQNGSVYYFDGGCTAVNSINLRSVIDIVDGGTEEGLLNVEFHPDFLTNNYVFFYHTSVGSTVNSVSRMTVDLSSGDLVLNDPVKIIDFRKVGSAGNHNGGGLVFAPDNTLLASVGDGGSGSAANAQVSGNLLGTVVRILPNLGVAGGYTIPTTPSYTGNMFDSGNAICSNITRVSPPCPEILAMGLRNPFRMSIDGNVVYLGDVGSNYEEINSFDYSAVSISSPINFGWPDYDGPVGSSVIAGYKSPILAYQRGDTTAQGYRAADPACSSDPGCDGAQASLILGDVYRGIQYEGLLTGRLLHTEFMDGYMRGISVNASGSITDNGTHIVHHDGITTMMQGPDGLIYIVTQIGSYYTGHANMIYRLVQQP